MIVVRRGIALAAVMMVSLAMVSLLAPRAVGEEAGDLVERGRYLVTAGGCLACHTDLEAKGEPFAGGAAIPTPFGTFYPPNITPHPAFGIGRWSDVDFRNAMRLGIRPDGAHYYPAFPYTSYTRITDEDLRAMRAYLATVAPVAVASTPHEIDFPFNIRLLQSGWKILFFRKGTFEPDPSRSPSVNRGAYLANALAHCGECHTPRNQFGGLDYDRWMAGSSSGPEGEPVPNLTPDPRTGLTWSAPEIVDYLKIGMTPEGDFAGSLMADVVSHNTGKLEQADLEAIAAYLKSLPPVRNEIGKGG